MHLTIKTVISSALVSCIAACGGDPVYFMSEAYLVDETGAETYTGGGCEAIGGDGTTGHGGSSLSGDTQYAISYEHEGDGTVIVSVYLDGAAKSSVERSYSREFIESGKTDDFSVPLNETASLHLRHWGGATCELAEERLNR